MSKKENTQNEETLNDTPVTDNLATEEQPKEAEAEKMTEPATEEATQTEATAEKPDFEAQANEWKDKYLRLSAEFDNYRKRTLKEKMDLTKFAGEDILKSILPVVDDFERGLKNIETAKDVDAVKEGMMLIYSKFTSFLTQKGMKEIEALNLDFNTDFHEAITKIPVEDKEMSGKIIDVVEKGYVLNEKVVRFSKVVVGE